MIEWVRYVVWPSRDFVLARGARSNNGLLLHCNRTMHEWVVVLRQGNDATIVEDVLKMNVVTLQVVVVED